MKNVLIFTSNYPYGNGETYLETEIEYLSQVAKVFIVPIGAKEENDTHRKLPASVELLNILAQKNTNKWQVILKGLFSRGFLAGIGELISCRKLTLKTLMELFKFIYAGETHFQRILNLLHKQNISIDKNLVAYSYWMDSSSYAALKLGKMGCKSITRAHGGDLYDERTPWNHQFLRKFIIKNIDYVCPISYNGKEYFEKRIGECANIIPVHLGIKDAGLSKKPQRKEVTFVSCSAAIKLKRIELIIEALEKLKNKNVKWVHFGEGPELKKLEALANKMLCKGSYEFKGQVTNSQLKEFYKNHHITAFVNASETEGVPVSIMEAISFGIPTVATDVGGVSEIVIDGINGFLVSVSSKESLVEKMSAIIDMSDEEYGVMRNNARNTFLSDWEYKNNYKKFFDLIIQNQQER